MNLNLEIESKELNWVIARVTYWGESELFGDTLHHWAFEGRLPHDMRRRLRVFVNSDPFYLKNHWMKLDVDQGYFELKAYLPQDVYKACRIDITQVITRK